MTATDVQAGGEGMPPLHTPSCPKATLRLDLYLSSPPNFLNPKRWLLRRLALFLLFLFDFLSGMGEAIDSMSGWFVCLSPPGWSSNRSSGRNHHSEHQEISAPILSLGSSISSFSISSSSSSSSSSREERGGGCGMGRCRIEQGHARDRKMGHVRDRSGIGSPPGSGGACVRRGRGEGRGRERGRWVEEGALSQEWMERAGRDWTG